MPTPLVIVGDGLWQPTGLARIARDLVTRLRASDLPIEVTAVGWEPSESHGGAEWYTRHQDSELWGAHAFNRHWDRHVDPHGLAIAWSIWDPARCFALTSLRPPNARWWGYFPIDAHGIHMTIRGPGHEAVCRYDRVLAYGRYGAQVLQTPDYLPHGLDAVFQPTLGQASWEFLGGVWTPNISPESIVVGAVVTNQPRKDLGLLFAAIRTMRERDHRIRLWLHIDKEIGPAWSIPQLAEVYGLGRALAVTTLLSDEQLAYLYSWCAVTIAPGLGEGFGYPIVESLGCGTPVVHGTYGGGAELVPHPAWRFPERMHRVEGVHALIRPVYDPQDVANAAWRAIEWRQAQPEVVTAYCLGAVAHLRWGRLWPRWEQWVRRGLEELE